MLWGLSTLQPSGRLSGHGEAVHVARFTPGQDVLVTAGYEGHFYVWDICPPMQGQLRPILRGHTREVNDLLVSRDGKYVISGAADNTVRVWELASGRSLQVIEEDQRDCATLALSPDGSLLAAAGWAGLIRLYRVGAQGRLHALQALHGHATRVFQVAFSPTGTHLASGSEGGTVRLWDVHRREELLHWHAHTQPVYSIAFHPQGALLASGSTDGTVRLWAVGDDPPRGESVGVLRNSGPYAGMSITQATGISDAQRSALLALGAVGLGQPIASKVATTRAPGWKKPASHEPNRW